MRKSISDPVDPTQLIILPIMLRNFFLKNDQTIYLDKGIFMAFSQDPFH